MGGNTYSIEDIENAKQPDESKDKPSIRSSKGDLAETKEKRHERKDKLQSKESEHVKSKEDKSQNKSSSSKRIQACRKTTSKEGMTQKENKPRSKEGSSPAKTEKKEKKCLGESSKEDKDIFARIAAGEAITPPVVNPPPNATVAAENNKAHGHYIQKGRFRYSPGFELIRNSVKESNGENAKQKTKKSAETVAVRKSRDDKPRAKATSSDEVINGPTKSSKKSPDVVSCKKSTITKSKNEKSGNDKAKKKRANSRNSTNTNSSVASKDMSAPKSTVGTSRLLEPKSKTSGKFSCTKDGKKSCSGKQSICSKPKSNDGTAIKSAHLDAATCSKATEPMNKTKEQKKPK